MAVRSEARVRARSRPPLLLPFNFSRWTALQLPGVAGGNGFGVRTPAHRLRGESPLTARAGARGRVLPALPACCVVESRRIERQHKECKKALFLSTYT